MKKILRLILFIIFYIPLRVLFPAKVIGLCNVPKGQKYMVASNHLHIFDVILLWFYLPGFKYLLAKKELGEKPIARGIFKTGGAIFVDREKPDLKAIKISVAALKKAPLVVFPEGTRNKTNQKLLPIKGGTAMIAAKADVPIMPVIIHHRHRLFKKNYMYLAPVFNLPYGPKDKFDMGALNVCTKLLTEEMTYAREFIDIAVEGRKKENKKESKKLGKQLKRAKKENKKEKQIKRA